MNPNNNTGSFLNPPGPTGQSGMGPNLSKLIQLAPNLGQGSPLNQNSTQMPPQAPQTQAIPQSLANNPQQMQNAAMQGNAGLPVQQQGAPELQIALNALANYVKAHGDSHMANNNVPLKTAHAKLVAAQAPQQPQGGQ